jgi:hypothetical protein
MITVDIIPPTLWGTGFVAVWAALPVALFFDARTLRETGDTVSYSHLKVFDTPGCRKSSRRYSQQYQLPVIADPVSSNDR